MAVGKRHVARRRVLTGIALGGLAGGTLVAARPALARPAQPLRFGLTPVFLTNDLDLLAALQSYLEQATGLPVELVSRRTYQEITALLVSRQLDAAWICGYPFVAYRADLALLAVPLWRGQPLYRSYLICDEQRPVSTLAGVAGDSHAFSDPDSNSGYLVTTAELARQGQRPDSYFRLTIVTYGHRNVVRAVAAGLVQSGSVDGYIYDTLCLVEPELTRGTRIVRASPFFGFPPIACPRVERDAPRTLRLRRALVGMTKTAQGRAMLAMLHLDGFTPGKESLFDSIAANMNLVRGLP